MHKYEKEYFKWLLSQEKHVLAFLKELYKEALEKLKKEIHDYTSGDSSWYAQRIYQPEYQEILAEQISDALDRLHKQEYDSIEDYLRDSYTNGFVGVAMSMHRQGVPVIMPLDEAQIIRALVTDSQVKKGLYDALGVDVDRLKRAISDEMARGIATNMSYGDIARNISHQMNISLAKARRIVLTEAHRIREAASQNARVQAREQGADVLKQWDATMDGRTRKTHRKLDGQIREVDEPFEVDGKKAMYPGGFGRPEEDINCRCVALTRARWAMDEEELERLKKRAEFFGLDKTEEFEEFKRRYMNAVQ